MPMTATLRTTPSLPPRLRDGDPSKQFKLLSRIGQGRSGTVHRAFHLPTESIVAVKIIELAAATETAVVAEIDAMSHYQHEYFVAYIGAWRRGHSEIWIVSELMDGGSLSDFVDITGHPLLELEIAAVMQMCCRALKDFHAAKRIHRDIKAANILFSSSGIAKLSDVGVAAQLSASLPSRHTTVGSPYWMAPEVCTTDADYNEKADIYSLACTAIELAHGEPPYHQIPPMRALFLIPTLPPPRLEPSRGRWSAAFNDFISQCTQRQASSRPSAGELLEHPFLSRLEHDESREILTAMWRAWGEKIIEYRAIELRMQSYAAANTQSTNGMQINESKNSEESQSSLTRQHNRSLRSQSESPRSHSRSVSLSQSTFRPSSNANHYTGSVHAVKDGNLPQSSHSNSGTLNPHSSNSSGSNALHAAGSGAKMFHSRIPSISHSQLLDGKADDDETVTIIDYSTFNTETRSPSRSVEKRRHQFGTISRTAASNFVLSRSSNATTITTSTGTGEGLYRSHSGSSQSAAVRANNARFLHRDRDRGSVSYAAYATMSSNYGDVYGEDASVVVDDNDLDGDNFHYREPSSTFHHYRDHDDDDEGDVDSAGDVDPVENSVIVNEDLLDNDGEVEDQFGVATHSRADSSLIHVFNYSVAD